MVTKKYFGHFSPYFTILYASTFLFSTPSPTIVGKISTFCRLGRIHRRIGSCLRTWLHLSRLFIGPTVTFRRVINTSTTVLKGDLYTQIHFDFCLLEWPSSTSCKYRGLGMGSVDRRGVRPSSPCYIRDPSCVSESQPPEIRILPSPRHDFCP